MAEFGPSVTEAPQTRNFVTPKEGIVKDPVGLRGVTNLFAQVKEQKATVKAAKDESFLSQFANTQLEIIQSVEQGKRSSQFARTLMRKNLMQAINDYPGLRKQLLSTNSSIIGQGGMGSLITEGTKEELRREGLRDGLVKQGVVSPDASEEEFMAAEENFRLAAEAKRRYDIEMDTIAMERAKEGLTQDKINTLNMREEQVAEKFLLETAPARMDQFRTTAGQLLGLIGTEGYDEGTVVSLIEERWNQFEQEMAPALAQVSGNTGTALMKGFREYKDLTLKRAKGEFTQEAYDREIDRVVSQQQAVALQNPQISKMVAISDLLGANAVLLQEQIRTLPAVSEYFNSNEDGETAANLYTQDPARRKAVKNYLDMLSLDPAGLTEDQKEEQARHVQRVFEGIEDYESVLQKAPEKGIALVTDWMSSQSFYKLRRQNPELFTNTDTAMRILQSNYGDEVWGMVKKQFRDNEIVTVTQDETEGAAPPTSRITNRRATASAVGYRSTTGGMEFYALDDTDGEAKQKARQLNKDLAPVINKNLKAFAHLEGSNDYGKYWEQIDEQYITGGAGAAQTEGGEATDRLAGGDAGDDLELEDFQFPTVSKNLPEDVANDTEFMGAVNELASDLEIDPSVVLAVMDFETGGSFDPAQKNAAGSSGTGLIQFMRATAKDLGTSVEDLAGMSRMEQMQWVKRYFNQYADEIRGGDASDVYMAVLFPRAIGKSPTYPLFRKGTAAYTQNKGLDRNGDGVVTKREAARKVVDLVGKYEVTNANFESGGREEPKKMNVPTPKAAAGIINNGLAPYDPDVNTPQDIGLGGPSTEYLVTVQDSDGNWMNIPSIWWNRKGSPSLFTEEGSRNLALEYEKKTGKKFPRFSNMEEAVEWAKKRSQKGGATKEGIAK